MELYIITALLIVYFITVVSVSPHNRRKIWTLAFITAFTLTAIAIFFIRGNTQDVMLATNEFNWYYFVYLFGSVSVALGLLNIWIYRSSLWDLLFSSHNDEDDEA